MFTDARSIIECLGLEPHPEGGHYCESYRAISDDGARGAVTSIYYLLQEGEVSRWHRIDALEIWHFHAGSPLALRMSADGAVVTEQRLGVNSGAHPQVVIPAGCWQNARTEGAWTLVGCTVAPAFDFAGFELAPEGWEPAA